MTRDQATGLVRRFEGYVVDYAENYLIPQGWFESIRVRRSVGAAGPVPWITYPALRVLPGMLEPHYRVLEYGAGSSALWLAGRVAQVVSVEHDYEWARRISAQAASNQVIVHTPLGAGLEPELRDRVGREFAADEAASYAAEALRFPTGYFDVISIDGIARLICVEAAIQVLAAQGFILFDNTDRSAYARAYEMLREAGFRRADFWGTGPVNAYEWCTSIFFRTDSRCFR